MLKIASNVVQYKVATTLSHLKSAYNVHATVQIIISI